MPLRQTTSLPGSKWEFPYWEQWLWTVQTLGEVWAHIFMHCAHKHTVWIDSYHSEAPLQAIHLYCRYLTKSPEMPLYKGDLASEVLSRYLTHTSLIPHFETRDFTLNLGTSTWNFTQLRVTYCSKNSLGRAAKVRYKVRCGWGIQTTPHLSDSLYTKAFRKI